MTIIELNPKRIPYHFAHYLNPSKKQLSDVFDLSKSVYLIHTKYSPKLHIEELTKFIHKHPLAKYITNPKKYHVDEMRLLREVKISAKALTYMLSLAGTSNKGQIIQQQIITDSLEDFLTNRNNNPYNT